MENQKERLLWTILICLIVATSFWASTAGARVGDCVPGSVRFCYTGPAGSRDIGGCKSGRQICQSNGSWGGCADEIHPVSPEVCNALDDDCDGQSDEPGAQGCTQFYRDGDQDGVGVGTDSACLCGAILPYSATLTGDCDDSNASVFPGAAEICNDRDDDCDGTVDNQDAAGCVDFVRDEDGDRYGLDGGVACLCHAEGLYSATEIGDCNDVEVSIHPSALEVCNGLSDDCDSITDGQDALGCSLFWRDEDQDTYGLGGDYMCLCAETLPYTSAITGDCNDGPGGESEHPAAVEVCNGLDDNCDGRTDEEGASGCTVYFKDADDDSYGDADDPRCLCSGPEGHYTALDATEGDCNDSFSLIRPGADEYCNGVDDDCDGNTDEQDAIGCINYYVDEDGDGFGSPAGTLCLCGASEPYTVDVGGDCDDVNGSGEGVNPGTLEQCSNNVDDDCDTATDEQDADGCAIYYTDEDNDGFGRGAGLCLCAPEDPVDATQTGDCDDEVGLGAAINPGATETCNGIDDDCDEQIDEDCGLATTGWPTYKFDSQRTGHNPLVTGPKSLPGERWKVSVASGPTAPLDFASSPLIMPDGSILVTWDDVVHNLAAADGATIWSTPLMQGYSVTCGSSCYRRAGPTVREGGTIYVPTGAGLSLLDEDGNLLWFTSFGGEMRDEVFSTPTVDSEGNAYLATGRSYYKVNPSGDIEWTLPIPNPQFTPAHGALGHGLDPRLYFAVTGNAVFAVELDGLVRWTFVDLGADVDSSVAVGAGGGYIYATLGADTVAIIDDTAGTGLGIEHSRYACGGDNDICPSVWNDGLNEYIFSSPNDNIICKLAVSDLPNSLDYVWDAAAVKDTGPGAVPVFDVDGDIYVGTNANEFIRLDQSGSRQWTYPTDDEVECAAAIGNGYVVFTDLSGNVYLLDE